MTFEAADCLIETDVQLVGNVPTWVARLYVLEDDGAIVRPIISEDQRLLTLFASSELTALWLATTWLADHFGAAQGPEQGCSLAASILGVPLVVATPVETALT